MPWRSPGRAGARRRPPRSRSRRAASSVVGEEVSWGQRLGGWETPGALREANVQEETTLHNVSGVDGVFRVALLLGALYGSCAWLAARRRPMRAGGLVLAPPLFLASLFVVPLVYFGVRLALFPSPSYGVAKFSELPELLVASGLLASSRSRGDAAARGAAYST